MDELVKTFHIDWKLMIAQIVNFSIVLGVLWHFALKPLMKTMDKRSRDIESSLKNAEEVEKKLQAVEEDREKVITEAKKEAQVILEKSYQEAEKAREKKISETRKEVEEIVKKTKKELELEKEKMVKEAKKEVTNLVIMASSKIIEKNLDQETNRKLVEDTISKIN